MIKDHSRLFMPQERVMRNIRNRHKWIKHINSFSYRVQVLGSRVPYILRVLSLTFMVPGPSFHSWAMFWVMRYVLGLPSFMVLGLMSQVSPVRWVPGLGSQVPPKVGSRVSGSIFWTWLKISMEKFNNFLYLQNFCSTKSVYIASALFWEIPKYHVLSID